jgi:hypothetical protein
MRQSDGPVARSLAAGQALRGRKRHPTIEDRVTVYAGATMVRQPSDNTHIALEQRHQVKAKTGRRAEVRRLPVLDLAIRRAQRVSRPRGNQTQDDVRTMAQIDSRGQNHGGPGLRVIQGAGKASDYDPNGP